LPADTHSLDVLQLLRLSMDEIRTEVVFFREAGFRIEESLAISGRGPRTHSFAYIVAEDKTGQCTTLRK
ncbi:MAG: hypothetical protein ACTH0R_09470, partial [Canibacter sp.]